MDFVLPYEVTKISTIPWTFIKYVKFFFLLMFATILDNVI